VFEEPGCGLILHCPVFADKGVSTVQVDVHTSRVEEEKTRGEDVCPGNAAKFTFTYRWVKDMDTELSIT
jgi:hypothetical protein